MRKNRLSRERDARGRTTSIVFVDEESFAGEAEAWVAENWAFNLSRRV